MSKTDYKKKCSQLLKDNRAYKNVIDSLNFHHKNKTFKYKFVIGFELGIILLMGIYIYFSL